MTLRCRAAVCITRESYYRYPFAHFVYFVGALYVYSDNVTVAQVQLCDFVGNEYRVGGGGVLSSSANGGGALYLSGLQVRALFLLVRSCC